MTFVDPKSGKLIWKASFVQGSAQSVSSGGVVAVMETVTGIIYNSGKAVDRLEAPTVTATNTDNQVIASGGVKITSLTKASTYLTCDRVVWNTSTNKFIGLGHVVFRTGGFTQYAPSFAGDTKLKDVIMPAPGRSSGLPVHVTFQQ